MQTTIHPQINAPFKLSLQTNNGKEHFLPGQIIRLEARSNYTKIFFTNYCSLVTAKVLKDFEPLLTPLGFVRVHRSHLVNMKCILDFCENGLITMSDHSILVISRRRKHAILKALSLPAIEHNRL